MINLCIFAKAPDAGKAKTRLIPALGAASAAQLQALMIRDTLRRFAGFAPGGVELWCAPDTDHPFFQACAREYLVHLREQGSGDLGERMGRAAVEGGVILIGSDCPMLQAGTVEAAGDALREGFEAALVPAEDGGYVLLALRRYAPELFSAMPWGTEQVLDETLARLARLGWRVQVLGAHWDVDRPADLARLVALRPETFGDFAF